MSIEAVTISFPVKETMLILIMLITLIAKKYKKTLSTSFKYIVRKEEKIHDTMKKIVK